RVAERAEELGHQFHAVGRRWQQRRGGGTRGRPGCSPVRRRGRRGRLLSHGPPPGPSHWNIRLDECYSSPCILIFALTNISAVGAGVPALREGTPNPPLIRENPAC